MGGEERSKKKKNEKKSYRNTVFFLKKQNFIIFSCILFGMDTKILSRPALEGKWNMRWILY